MGSAYLAPLDIGGENRSTSMQAHRPVTRFFITHNYIVYFTFIHVFTSLQSWLSNSLAWSVPDEGQSRNASCAP